MIERKHEAKGECNCDGFCSVELEAWRPEDWVSAVSRSSQGSVRRRRRRLCGYGGTVPRDRWEVYLAALTTSTATAQPTILQCTELHLIADHNSS